MPIDSFPYPIGETRFSTSATMQGLVREAMKYGIETGWAFAVLFVQTVRDNHLDRELCDAADIMQGLAMSRERALTDALSSVDFHVSFAPGAHQKQ